MSSTTRKKRVLPVTWRVTLWYTLFIAIILVIVFALSAFIYQTYSNSTVERELVESVTSAAHDILNYENIEDFQFFQDGIYYSVYQFDGTPVIGGVFEDFDVAQTLSFEEPRRVGNYIYYDTLIPNQELYIRGVQDISTLENQSQSMLTILLVAMPIILLIAATGGYRIMKSAFSLVGDVTETALEIQHENDLSKRIDVGDGNDEITQMAQAFNEMLDNIQKSYYRERQFSQDVSHELRTPISVILAESQYALAYATTLEESKDSHRTIERQSLKMKELLNQVLELARLDGMRHIDKEEINLSNLILDSTDDLEKIAGDKEIVREIDGGVHILGSKLLLSRLVDNLFSNANKFADKRIIVRLYAEDSEAILEVSDDGPGIDNEDQDLIFNRFYQTDRSRNKKNTKGYGLGLSFVRAIAEQHDGSLEVESVVGIGSNFRVRFPLDEAYSHDVA